ncbi:MAG: pirin family protein [Cytophagales bacterium]|nr:pirin family protein [Cytophagales bacterium]MDW8384780.1 pirin family protein [Flammeovirgaceae bacterium]
MNTILHKSSTRGVSQGISWLKSYYSFSFANYYNPERIHFGMLRVLNDDIIAPGAGFGMHPHENMEIISIPLSGELKHQDNLGNQAIITKGDVQVMSAGKGIFHSELNPHPHREGQFLQIWIFPKERNIAPRYAYKTFSASDFENRWNTIVAPNNPKALWINQEAWLQIGKFSANTFPFYQFNRSENGVYLFVIDGKIKLNDIELSTRDALGIWQTNQFSFQTLSDAEILLIEVPMH